MNEKLAKLQSSYKAIRAKVLKKLEKPVAVCKIIFGYGIMISLFAGGLTLLGYVFALCVGGDLATQICTVIKQHIIPAITYLSTIMVLFGLVIMYMSGQVALSAKKKPKEVSSSDDDEGER